MSGTTAFSGASFCTPDGSANSLETFALAFLDEYLWDVYMYDPGDYTPYMTLPAGNSTVDPSTLSDDELAILQAAQSNMQYIEDKAAYWRAGRQAYGGTRRDFSASYEVMDSSIQDDRATLNISAIVTFYYGDTDSISLGQHIFELSFAKVGESWIIADVLEINDWFDSHYKNDPEFDVERLITEMVDAITASSQEDEDQASAYDTGADHEGIVVYVSTEFSSLTIWENDPLQGEGYASFSVDHAEDFKVGDRIRFAVTGYVMERSPLFYSEVENVRVIK